MKHMTKMTNRLQDDENDILQMYMNEIHKIPLLTREEEDAIAEKAATGDRKATDALVKANLRFVVRVARRYMGHGMSLADLISEGNIGLINAVEHYSVKKGVHFVTYAVWWIRQSIIKALNDKSRTIRIPANKVAESLRVHKRLEEVDGDTGREVLAAAAKSINRDTAYVKKLLDAGKGVLSLDQPNNLYAEGGADNIGAYIADDKIDDPIEAAYNEEVKNVMNVALYSLPKREAEVLRRRYGLDTGCPMTLDEVGNSMKISKERVRQLETRAMQNLRHPARTRVLLNYVA
jgi:RNA polymerase primary sigma factor